MDTMQSDSVPAACGPGESQAEAPAQAGGRAWIDRIPAVLAVLWTANIAAFFVYLVTFGFGGLR